MFKQQHGEYMGSITSGWLESMVPMVKPDADTSIGVDAETFAKGLANAVKDNDLQFPPEWRLSMKGRKAS